MCPELQIIGIEPVLELILEGREAEYTANSFIAGDAANLPFSDKSFDAVVITGVLHHVPDPQSVISEILRVAKLVVVVSDGNVYGWGSPLSCTAKTLLRYIFGRRFFAWCLTRGKGFHDSDHDGIYYPFSLRDHLEQLQSACRKGYLLTTRGHVTKPGMRHSHLAFIGRLR